MRLKQTNSDNMTWIKSPAAAADDDLEDADDNRDELLDLFGSFDIADAWLPSASSSTVSPVHTALCHYVQVYNT